MSWDIDLQWEHERYITQKHAGRPVMVTNYPKAIKAFYVRAFEWRAKEHMGVPCRG